MPPLDVRGAPVWVTRARPKVDRIAARGYPPLHRSTRGFLFVARPKSEASPSDSPPRPSTRRRILVASAAKPARSTS